MTSPAAPFFAGCQAAFAEARGRCPGPDRRFTLAGASLALRFAGEQLAARLLPAFALPAAVESSGKDGLDIVLWDLAETGVAAPPMPWPRAALGVLGASRGRVPGFCDATFETVLDPGHRILWMLDRAAGRAVAWFRGAAALPAWEQLHPLRALLQAWATHRGLHLLHAGAVGDSRGDGLLVVGRGGSGKSTTVLAALAGGMTTVGDDYVALQPGVPPRAWALYGSMRLFADHAARFPHLLPAVEHSAEQDGRLKLASYVGRQRPAQMAANLALGALVAPRPDPGGRTRVEPLSADEALAALAPSTLRQMRPRDATLVAMQALCARLPAHRLHLGADLAVLPGLLRGLIASRPAEAEATT